jgi:pimeloyl-ACP methyl ester carboxylesterase
MEPISQYYYSHRLKLHFWDWGENGKPNLILVHGMRDHARSWDSIAEAFLPHFRVLAPDLRGHGDSSWTSGAAYTIPEFVLDISALIDIVGKWPVYMIGHSLGGAIVLQYAGVYPDRVKKLVDIEGFAIPPEQHTPGETPDRLRNWIEKIRTLEVHAPHKYPGVEAAVTRMYEANHYLTEETARHLTLFGTNWSPDGSLTWKFDNYVRALSPCGFNVEETQAVWRRITCPALIFRGLDSWALDPEEDGRLKALSDFRLINVPKAGHWVHHDQPDVFIAETRDFLFGRTVKQAEDTG